MLSAAPRATLRPLSCSPNFLRAQYLCIRALTHELREWSLTIGGGGRAAHLGRAKIFWARIREGYNFWAPLGDVRAQLNGFCATEILSTA